jgi:hypothetical protein
MKDTTVKTKSKPVPIQRKRYEPKPPPVSSFAFNESPLNTTTRVKVMRWHSYHGVPTLFMVVDKHGYELCRFPRELDALAHCKDLERELSQPELYIVSDAP